MTTYALDPALVPLLGDARRQTHQAAQLATAAGISYLPPAADDSHTNLEWRSSLGALASNLVPESRPFRLALRVADLTLLLVDGSDQVIGSFALHRHTIADAATWVRARLTEIGIDGRRYTLTRHYSIPVHPVADGAAFDTTESEHFVQISRWFACAADVFGSIVSSTPGASVVRCWPHHFDIATLISLGGDQSIGVGMEPGDVYYDEPYFYVNMYPQPSTSALTAQLAGNGTWHTHEWIGAVLTGSRVTAGDGQDAQVRGFLDSSIATARSLLPGHTAVGATSP